MAISRLTVQAMKGGAIEFLTKPFRDQEILEAIQQGLARDRARLDNEKTIARTSGPVRELECASARSMAHVVTARLNAQTMADMGISEMTPKPIAATGCAKRPLPSPKLARMADPAGRRPWG